MSATQQIAADIVSRLPALSQDSPLNAAQTIEGMLETIAPVSVLAMEARELRFKVAELKKERDQLEAKLRAAEAALDGRLGNQPESVQLACLEYVAAEDALPEWCDGEDYTLSKAVASVVRQNAELTAERDKWESACRE